MLYSILSAWSKCICRSEYRIKRDKTIDNSSKLIFVAFQYVAITAEEEPRSDAEEPDSRNYVLKRENISVIKFHRCK